LDSFADANRPSDDDTTVRLVNDMYSYPAVPELVRVTIEPVEIME
jgi:hypothetical protein